MENLKKDNLEVVVTRQKTKKPIVLGFVDLALCVVFVVLFIVNFVITKGFSEGKGVETTKILSFVLIGLAAILLIYSIFSLVYAFKHNKKIEPCLFYDKEIKVFIASTVYDKKVEFHVQSFISIKKDLFSDGKIVIDYMKSNGKKDRISLGWSEDYTKALNYINEVRDQH